MSGFTTSIIPLLSEWEKYTHEVPAGDIPGFARWILSRQEDPAQSIQAPAPAYPPQSALPTPPARQTGPVRSATANSIASQATGLDDNAQGALLIARNHRILRLFSKPVIKDLGFTKDIEFSAVVHVAIMDHPNKKQLCQELLIENSTGVEITRRLARKGLIAETPDPADRRSALLSITDKGRKTLEQGYYRLSAVHTSFLDALGPEEKHQLVSLLARINQYHTSRINNSPDFLE